MKTVVITGSQGFIGGYLCRELLSHGYRVIGVDNFSKYGPVKRDYDDHPNFKLRNFDLADNWSAGKLYSRLAAWDAEYLIAGAAMIGGISYFHKYAYDLLATNERIIANTFDAAIKAFQKNSLKRIVVISSSMVYEGADSYNIDISEILTMYGADCCGIYGPEDANINIWPTKEDNLEFFPPPNSTYGFQKLATEYFCKGAYEQHKLPYTIVRPFNCVGIGEDEAVGEEEVYSGNVKLQMSHVLPDLINKVLSGQDPLHILGDGNQIRCYTHGRDIARGIRLAMESERAENQSYNISSSRQTTVKELAEIIWKKTKGDKPLKFVHDKPYMHDVQKRVPDVSKAQEHLGFSAEIALEDAVDEVIEYMTRSKFQNV